MTVETFTARKSRRVRGTRVESGQTLYAVCKNGRYFVWSYVHREMAEAMDRRLTAPTDATDIAFNWRVNVHDTTPSARESAD